MKTKVRLVRMIEGSMHAETIETTDVAAAIEVRGFAFAGVNVNPRQRDELQNQPKFVGLCGPMFDGDAIRYECHESNDRLSA